MLHARLNGRTVGFRHNGRAAVHNGRSGLHASQRPLSLLLSSSQLYIAPYTAIPIRGAVTPSFTRNLAKNILDFAGREVRLLPNECGFWHVNRVYNLWGTTTTTLASGGNNSMTLTAGTYIFSMGAGTGTATFSGTGGATGTLAASAVARTSVTKTITAGSLIVTASVADLADLQVEDRTGASNTTDAMPYVSIGVESAPAYHGSMVDGVKTFPYDYSGNPLPTSESAEFPQRGHHVEGSAQNLCLQSNAFTTTWVNLNAPSATQNAIGPNGKANYAWVMSDNSAIAFEGKNLDGVVFAAGTNGCFSILVGKKVTSPVYPLIQFVSNEASYLLVGILINEVAGTVSNVPTGGAYIAPIASGCRSYNDDFWLVWVAATQAGATATSSLKLYPAGSTDGTTLSAAGQGSTVFCDAQFELGLFPSSRINTTTVAVTRPADVLSYTGALCGQITSLATSFWRPVGVATAGAIVSLSNGTANEYSSIGLTSATAVQFSGVDGGAAQWATTASNAYTPGTQSKVAQSAATNSVLMDLDGTAQTPDTTATMPTYTTLQHGHLNGASQINGAVGPTFGWIRLLSQSELTAIDK